MIAVVLLTSLPKLGSYNHWQLHHFANLIRNVEHLRYEKEAMWVSEK